MSHKIIKAALNGQKSYKGKCYLLNGSRYIRYDWQKDKPDRPYPKSLSVWKLKGEFGSDIDAALNGQKQFKGFAYFFKGDQYLKYDWAKEAPIGDPKPLRLWGLKESFSKGIDAACNGKGPYANFGYLFKGEKYITYDWTKDAPFDGKLRDISLWKLPGGFNFGVDAAMDGDGPFSNYTYFFKNELYVRYDWTNYVGYGPFSISEFWRIENTLESNAHRLYKVFGLEDKIAFHAFRFGYLGYECIGKTCDVPNVKKTNSRGIREFVDYDNSTGYLNIIDFTKPSNEPRFVVLNMLNETLRSYLHISHGVNSSGRTSEDRRYARYFSNTKGSNKSSLGFFVTGWPFPRNRIKDGVVDERVWLKLHGMEPGINDKAQARGIMMHTANYVSETRSRAGRSDGCPATDGFENQIVNGRRINALYEEIKNGNLLFAYTIPEYASYENDVNYYGTSAFLVCLEHHAKNSFGIRKGS